MPSFKFKLEDGRVGRVEGSTKEEAMANFQRFVMPDMMRRAGDNEEVAPPAAPPPPVNDRQARIDAQVAKDKELYDPAKGMNWLEKGAVGFQSGLRNAASGAKDLVGLEDDEGRQERIDREERNKPLGNWGKAGTVAGEIAATAIPGGGAAAGGGKLLVKALPAMEKVAKWGGKYINAGTVARSATQAGVQEGLVGKAGDNGDLGARAVDAAKGAAWGAAVPLGLKGAAAGATALPKAIVGIKNTFSPSAGKVTERAYNSMKGAVGEDELLAARKAMELQGGAPPTIPQTTAALSGNASLAAMERGARGRSNVNFNQNDEASARSAWEALQPMPGRDSEAGEILRSQFMRNGVPQTERMFGELPGAVPNVESRPLRKALGRLGPHMDPDEVDMATKVANDLTKKELVKHGEGTMTPDVALWSDRIPLVIASLFHAKTGGLGNALLNRAKVSALNDVRLNNQGKVMREIDEALLDPDKFMKMVDDVQAKILRGQTLTEVEKVVKRTSEVAAEYGGREQAREPALK